MVEYDCGTMMGIEVEALMEGVVKSFSVLGKEFLAVPRNAASPAQQPRLAPEEQEMTLAEADRVRPGPPAFGPDRVIPDRRVLSQIPGRDRA